AKLARRAKPVYVTLLCVYSDQIARLQGLEPELMHVVLGTGERISLRRADFAAYCRRVRTRFLAFAAGERETYPYPVEHCRLCDFKPLCDARWDADDHLVRVANIRRDQIVRLTAAGIATLEALGLAPPGSPVRRMAPTTFGTLRK